MALPRRVGVGHNGAPYYPDPHDGSRMVDITANHREIGDIPGCRQSIYVETLCEQQGIPPDTEEYKVIDVFFQALKDFNEGNYVGRFSLFSLYWEHVKRTRGIKPIL